MGLLVYLFQGISKYLLLLIIGYFLYRILSNNNRKDEVLLAAGYITGYEVFSRMTGGTFSYEFAKYAVVGFLVLGMFYRGFTRSSWPYLFYLVFLMPGIFFSAVNLEYDTNVGNAIGFNLSGPICLGISALYCYNRKMPAARLQQILLAVLLPLITTTVYLYFYTPSIRDTLQGTASNFEASGGYGPNQVATVLGLGMFILFSRLLLIKNRFINLVDLVLLAFISYRGIVTFSRGGILTAIVCAILFLGIYYLKSGTKERKVLVPKMGLIAGFSVLIWLVTSIATMGLIDKRYSNEDAAGNIKDDISTGRVELIETEINAFYDNPITGLGVGKMKEYREETTGEVSATHNEISRMLSEHGLFGIFSLLILFFAPLLLRLKNRSNLYLFSFLAFWFLTINHSSMRIAAPAFIYGLGLISIVNAKRKHTLHRK
ncbi:O-antigen ligase family protein [Aequorivita echinoideorum]|uniref:O-antigen ligase family protein n=2 Tax=Aequorivita echinoideorum TaxID=1549647 RepID=A0ABS5S5H2_9FLAO|nr:O-antigen ligase family protein [Aequorivita echinoideorum]